MIFPTLLWFAWVCPGLRWLRFWGTGRDSLERHLTAIGMEIDMFAGGYDKYM